MMLTALRFSDLSHLDTVQSVVKTCPIAKYGVVVLDHEMNLDRATTGSKHQDSIHPTFQPCT